MSAPKFDRFDRSGDSPSNTDREAFMIAPHDTQGLTRLPKALMIGVTGTLTIRAVDSAADITVTVTAGQIVPIRVTHVRATGTTAGQIVGLA